MKKLGFTLFLFLMLAAVVTPAAAQISVGIAINVGPPAIPVYAQPPVPAPNYIWTPGYWAYGPAGYYWVPGAWMLAPEPGLVWTPGYWAWNDGSYVWNPGYWATQVGYYGGVDYGNGYYGSGYAGGRWRDNVFVYNTAVTNVNRRIVRNVFIDRTVIVRQAVVNRISFNGGPNGLRTRPTVREIFVDRFYRHYPATIVQVRHERIAGTDRVFLARVNHGHPAVVAVEHPLTAVRRASTVRTIARAHPAVVVHHITKVHELTTPQRQIARFQKPAARPLVVHHEHTVVRPEVVHRVHAMSQPAPHPHATKHPQR